MLLVLWLVITMTLGWLVFTTALDKNTSKWAWLLLMVVGIAALVAATFAIEGIFAPRQKLRSILRPRPIAGFYLATFSAFGVMATLLSQFAPKPAMESAPLATEQKVDKANVTLARIVQITAPKPPAVPRILVKIEGTWGEKIPRCGVTYSMTVVGGESERALKIEGVHRPRGVSAWATSATIRPFGADGDTMYTDADGDAASFVYSSNGAVESLSWITSKHPPLDLIRC
jgi:hypothetical protein